MDQCRSARDDIANTLVTFQILGQITAMQSVIDILLSSLGKHRLGHIDADQVTDVRANQLSDETGSATSVDDRVGAMCIQSKERSGDESMPLITARSRCALIPVMRS